MFDQKIRSMLINLEQLGVFSLMRDCMAKWLKAHLKNSERGIQNNELEQFTLNLKA